MAIEEALKNPIREEPFQTPEDYPVVQKILI